MIDHPNYPVCSERRRFTIPCTIHELFTTDLDLERPTLFREVGVPPF